MDIVRHQDTFCKQIITYIPKRLHRMFRFAFFAYSIEHVTSARGNARKFVKNAYTAKSKAWRFLKNEHLRDRIPTILALLAIVTKESVVAIDFSAFGPWQVLMFAVQTRRGRATPVYFKIITYPIEKDSQNIFIIEAIEAFVACIGCRPKLVFDRGFACPAIIKHLAQQKHIFYIRLKGGKHVKVGSVTPCQARTVTSNDVAVVAYDLSLRLVTSGDPRNGNEPWYIITNDKHSHREMIIERYYFRFEIEEFFKDAKWVQGLEWTHFNKIESITTLLWFVLIGWWCITTLIMVVPKFSIPHPKAHISQFRHVFETLLRVKNFLLLHALGYDSI